MCGKRTIKPELKHVPHRGKSTDIVTQKLSKCESGCPANSSSVCQALRPSLNTCVLLVGES